MLAGGSQGLGCRVMTLGLSDPDCIVFGAFLCQRMGCWSDGALVCTASHLE